MFVSVARGPMWAIRTTGMVGLGIIPLVAATPGVAAAADGSVVSAAATVTRTYAAEPSTVTAQSAYRYWSYWWGQADGGWTYASMGAPSTRPKDGAVEGWRFAISGDGPSSSRAPRTSANMAALCPDLTSAPSGQKRVAVVLDFGTASEAPSGETPPPARVACVVVPTSANGVQVLAAATSIRSKDGLVCALSGYPHDECANTVADTPSTPAKPPTRRPVRAPAAAPSKAPVRPPAGAVRRPPVTVGSGDTSAGGNVPQPPTTGQQTDGSQDGAQSDGATMPGTGVGAGVVDPATTVGTGPAPSVAAAGAQAAETGREPGSTEGANGGTTPSTSGESPSTAGSALAEEPVAFVRQDSEESSAGSTVATLIGVAAVIVALASFWVFTRSRRQARAATSFRHRRQR